MHKISINPAQIERGRWNRDGRDQAFKDLDMSRVAHVIVDMQNGFLAEGAVAEIPVARAIVDNVNEISRAVRSAGGQNIFLRYTYDKNEKRPWNSWYKSLLGGPFSTGLQEAFTPGNQQHEIWPRIDIAPGETILNKTRFSAFVPGTCELDNLLQESKIDTVIITGTVTNHCSEATARGAHELGYCVIFAADGNATFTDEEHNAALGILYGVYADVLLTEQIVDLISKSSRAAA